MAQSASRGAARARPARDRSTLYEEITNRIIAELEAGRLPWVQPWGSSGVRAPLGMSKNGATSRAYSGINVLILWAAVVEHGFSTQTWLTFKQALGFGGNVRKGIFGTLIRPTADITLTQAASTILAAIAVFGLAIFVPGIAAGLITGAPQLGAGAAVATTAATGGTIVAGGMLASGAARLAGRASGAAIRAAASLTGTVGAAYQAGGLRGVARATVTAPAARAVASSTAPVRDAYREGAAQGYRGAGPSSGPDPNPPGGPGGAGPAGSPPAWAQRLARRQRMTQAGMIAAQGVSAAISIAFSAATSSGSAAGSRTIGHEDSCFAPYLDQRCDDYPRLSSGTSRGRHTGPSAAPTACASARDLRPPGVLRRAPVDAFKHVAELRRRDAHGAVSGRRPDVPAALQPLGEQARAVPVVPDDLQKIAAPAPEHEQVAAMRILLQRLLHQHRERRKPLAHISVAGRQPHTHAAARDRLRRHGDHRRASSASIMRTSAPVSNVRSDPHRAPAIEHDLDCARPRQRACRRRRRRQRDGNEARCRCGCCGGGVIRRRAHRRPELATPAEQHVHMNPVPPRHLRQRGAVHVDLGDDRLLLLRAPAPTPPRPDIAPSARPHPRHRAVPFPVAINRNETLLLLSLVQGGPHRTLTMIEQPS